MIKEKFEFYFIEIVKNLISRKWFILAFLLFIILGTIGITEIGKVSNYFSFKYFLVFFVIFVSGALCIVSNSDVKHIHNLTFMIVLIFGLISCVATPILDSPDEYTHLRRAEITSRGELFPEILNEQGYVTIQSIINIEKEQGKSFLSAQQTDINNNKVQVAHIAESNFFVGYIPQAIGISLAKILHLSEIWMVLLGRAINVLFASAIARYAVKIIKGFKIPIMAICCMPMAVYQAASLSIDCTINYCSILTIAYFIRLYESIDKSITIRQIGCFCLICFIAGISKITYMALTCLIILLPKRKFKDSKSYYIAFIAVLSMGIIAVLWYIYTLGLPKIVNEQTNYLIQNNVNIVEQSIFVMNNFLQVMHMLLRELLANGQQIFSGFFTFGWLSYSAPLLTYLYSLFYGSILLLYPNITVFDKKVKVGIIGICFLIFIATETIMYLTWTGVGSLSVAGVQSRYYLPLLALFPMFFNLNGTLRKGKNIELYYSFCMICFLTFMLMTTIVHYS